MIRNYEREPIPRETLERIAATVRRAPSGGFSQGQRLLVVDDPALLEQLAALNADVPEGVEPWFASAPAQIFVLTREADYHERYQQDDKLQDGEEIEWPVPFWHVDAGAALMLVLLAAIDEGLGAAVYGIPLGRSAHDSRTCSRSPPTMRSSPESRSGGRCPIPSGAS